MKSPAFIAEKTGPPVIDLGDIRLRPLRPGDELFLFEHLTDARVIEHTSIPLLDLDTLATDVKRDIAAYAAGTSCRWALATADDRLIGICGFNNWSFVHEHAELAYDLNPSYWGRGLHASRRDRRAPMGLRYRLQQNSCVRHDIECSLNRGSRVARV